MTRIAPAGAPRRIVMEIVAVVLLGSIVLYLFQQVTDLQTTP
jgi:hypothetical protein